MSKGAIGYIRVSTTDQADNGLSLDAQREKIQAWCLVHDMTLDHVFVDAGLSGKRADNRPALQDAMNAACSSGSVLVVYSLSRLARSTRDTIELAEKLSSSGSDLVSLSEKIDTQSAAGKMVFRMLAVLNEFERDQLAERTKELLKHKRLKGERVGKVPFGFTLAADGIRLIRNDQEFEIINLIEHLREEGLSLRSIASELSSRGIQTKEGNSQWSHTAVNRIIKGADFRRKVAA